MAIEITPRITVDMSKDRVLLSTTHDGSNPILALDLEKALWLAEYLVKAANLMVTERLISPVIDITTSNKSDED